MKPWCRSRNTPRTRLRNESESADMRFSAWAGLVLVLSIPSTIANSKNTNARATELCELHFWPASSVDTYPQPTNAKGGPLWSLAFGGQKRAEALQAVRSDIASSLDGEGSALALGQEDIANRLGFPSSSLVIHDAPLNKYGLSRIRDRRATSNSPCYSELIVTAILFKNGSWGGHFLDSTFMLREFGSRGEPSRVTTGGGSIRLTVYPTKEGQDAEAAQSDLNSAFRQGFDNFVAKVRKARGL